MLQFHSMFVLEAVQSFFIILLSGYLAFTSTLAEHIESRLPFPPSPSQITEEHLITSPSEELVNLSRLYAQPRSVARVLRENPAFQEAIHNSVATVQQPLDLSLTKDDILESLVNILCRYSTDAYTRTTTGTGFFIQENGVVLTNAHVAQFLLLEAADETIQKAECIIRSGDPATAQFRAELLFISPSWIAHNAELITEEVPQGTGEYDYALLYITESIDDTPLPERYPAIPTHTDYLSKRLIGTNVFGAGYPAENLLREGMRAKLEPKIALTTVHDMFTFGSNYADIFSISDSSVGEQGASGGPVVHPQAGAIGLIVTKGDYKEEGARSLRALTLSYINRTILEETGFSLEANSTGNLEQRGKVFKEALAPFLRKLLTLELDT